VTPGSGGQRNPYKGTPPRPWVRLRFAAPAGAEHSLELLADTGNPCAVIISRAGMAQLKRADGPDMATNFGVLEGGWLRLAMPELGLLQDVLGYASDAVVAAAKASSPDFEGLVGLPLLRLLEYGGDKDAFWIRLPGSAP
jgi:hypothetical protein